MSTKSTAYSRRFGKRKARPDAQKQEREFRAAQAERALASPSAVVAKAMTKRQEKRKARNAARRAVRGNNSIIPPSDVRLGTETMITQVLANQLRSITITKGLDSKALTYLSLAFVSRALERGFMGESETIYDAFYAIRYMANILASYVQGLEVPVVQLPYWLLCLGHAISPKTTKFGLGAVSYKFAVSSALPVVPASPNFNIGPTVYPFEWTAGWPSGTVNTGWPVISTLGSSYTDALGATAFQQVCQWMTQAATPEERRLSRMVTSSTHTPFESDVSAFSIFSQAEGGGATGSGGGIYGLGFLETKMLHPLLGLFSSVDDNSAPLPTRNFNEAQPVAGDVVFLGAMMSTIIPTIALKANRTNKFKPVDFNEFADVLATWVTLIAQAFLTAQGSTLTEVQASGVVCPLSLQEVMLCLRNTIMSAFKETQAAVQGLCPFRPSGGGDNQFVSFTSASNTCPLNALDMQLPIPFIENIRALTSRLIHYSSSPSDCARYIPMLGQYALDVLASSDYQVTFTVGSGSPTTVNIFATGPFYERVERTIKGEEVRVPLVEPTISLVDGSFTGGQLMINDPENLKRLVSMWNQWFTGSGVQSFSVQSGTLGAEKGISALASVASTRLWSTAATINRQKFGESRAKSLTNMPKVMDVRMRTTSRKPMVNTPYATRLAIVDTSQGTLLNAPYEEVLSTWILPCVESEDIVGSESTVNQRWQFMMEEPHSQARTSGTTGISLGALHMAYAAKMVKANLANQDDWTVFFEEQAKLGRGGVLSGMVANLVSKFSPTAGELIRGVTDILPL